MAAGEDKKKNEKGDNDDSSQPKIQAASIRDTLSFGSGTKKNVCMIVGSFFAMASGAALPGEC